MPEELGRRERKKQVTRRALVDAATRLFAEHGYDRTAVGDIAEAADVSKRTFFLHFPTKEDVLLADAGTRVELGIRAIQDRPAGSSVRDVLLDATGRMIADLEAADLPSGLAGLRARLVVESPAVQARVLHVTFTAQHRIAEELRQAYPDRLDSTDALAMVGALMGAVGAVAVDSLRRGDPPERTRTAVRRAAELALAGLDD